MMSKKARLALAVVMIGSLAACKSGVKTNQNAAGELGTQPNPNAVAQVTVDPLNDPNSPLAKRSIYFDFDSYTVSDQYQSLLQAHAQYLKSHPERHVLLQGNTDERGTSEYNLALGARRANSVKEYLVSLGVSAGRLDTISYGKERPICTESDESCWAQNRRGVTTITGGANS